MEELEKVDKIESITFRPSIDFPLVNSEFSMEEFLTEGESKAKLSEQNGIMVLTYNDSVETPSGESFFVLPNQQSPVLSVNGPEVSFPSPGGSITISKNLTFGFTTTQEVLDSILIKAGAMLFTLDSNFPANINLTISIPSLKRQGTGFSQNFILNGPGVQSPSINLQGFSLDLTANGTTTNTVTFAITATITDTGQPINNTHRLNCSFRLNTLRFRGLFGNLGTRGFPFGVDSIDVDIFSNAETGGTFELYSPAIRLDIRNSFGLPIGFDIQSMAVIKPDNTVVPLTGSAVSAPANPYLINGPSYSQIGQFVNSTVAINSGNSNLAQLISALPQYLAFQLRTQLNPNNVTKNFALDDSKVKIGVHFELPFHCRFARLTVEKEYDFTGLGIDDILDSKIKVRTTNETPLEAQLQVYFVDSYGVVLDSLFTNRSILKGAPVDGSAVTQGSAEVITEVLVSKAKVDRINQAERLLIRATLFTTNAGAVPVKFSASDKLKVNIGVNTRYEYKPI